MEKRELVILGAGPAGMTAAIYGKRSGLDVLVLEKGIPGGQIAITDEIENWPGVIHATGAELAESFRRHAEKFAPEFRDATVTGIEVRNGTKVLVTEKEEIEAEAIILATGATFKKLGCPGEAEFAGRGVSYCAVCDGAFFQDVEIAVVGGGNTAVEEAVYLTQFASKVYIIHRRDSFRADKMAVERALGNPKIIPVWNSVVESIQGSDMVEKLLIRNVKSGEVSELPVEGVFVFTGMVPNAECVKGLVKTTEQGWILTDEKMETSMEGLFAAGDVRDKYLRQVVTAAGDGAVAAMAAYAYISEQVHLRGLLLEPERVVALFFSSVDEKQMRLVDDVEKWIASSGKHIVFVDGYRNAKMVEKLGLAQLPLLVELRKGSVASSRTFSSVADLRSVLS
jgi:thioredoxin reductase (NADPH)